MRYEPVVVRDSFAVISRPGTDLLTVLSIGPNDDDTLTLQAIIGHPPCMLFTEHSLKSAMALLQRRDISVVVCEPDLRPGKYSDLLEHINAIPNSPSLIVASRLADDRLWAEALNLGAWDVLSKPFDHTEVLRSVKSGWQHWRDRRCLHEIRAKKGKVPTIAGIIAATGT